MLNSSILIRDSAFLDIDSESCLVIFFVISEPLNYVHSLVCSGVSCPVHLPQRPSRVRVRPVSEAGSQRATKNPETIFG